MRNELYQLHEWADLVLDGHLRKHLLPEPFEPMVRAERERVTLAFHENYYSHQGDVAVRRFFRNQQQILLEMSRKLLKGTEQPDHIQIMIEAVDTLEFDLQKEYSDMISADFPASRLIAFKTVTMMYEQIPAIAQFLKARGIDEELQKIVLDELEVFADAPEKEYLISEINFFRELSYLFENMSSKLARFEPKDLSETLVGKLCAMNFNAPAFIEFCKLRIKKSILPKPTIPEELFVLEKLLRHLQRLKSSKRTAFDHEQPSAAFTLTNWLKALCKLKEREMGGNFTEDSETAAKHAESRKINLTLSIGEAGLLFRLLHLAGVVRTNNKKALARLLSQILATQYKSMSERADENHLYSAMLSSTKSIVDSMEKILNRMQTKLREVRKELKKPPSGNS